MFAMRQMATWMLIQSPHAVELSASPTVVDLNIIPVDPAQFPEALGKGPHSPQSFRIILREIHEDDDAPYRKWPSRFFSPEPL